MNRYSTPAGGTATLSVGTLALLVSLVSVGARTIETSPWRTPMLDRSTRDVAGPAARGAAEEAVRSLINPIGATRVEGIRVVAASRAVHEVFVVVPAGIGVPDRREGSGGGNRRMPPKDLRQNPFPPTDGGIDGDDTSGGGSGSGGPGGGATNGGATNGGATNGGATNGGAGSAGGGSDANDGSGGSIDDDDVKAQQEQQKDADKQQKKQQKAADKQQKKQQKEADKQQKKQQKEVDKQQKEARKQQEKQAKSEEKQRKDAQKQQKKQKDGESD